ncbi:uncharacterized protein LOC144591268 isoform X1 [Rhinoraja longicauda]
MPRRGRKRGAGWSTNISRRQQAEIRRQQEKTGHLKEGQKRDRKRAQESSSEEMQQTSTKRLRDNQKGMQHRREEETQQETTEHLQKRAQESSSEETQQARTKRLRDEQTRMQHSREQETQQETTERLKHLRKSAQDTRSEETRQVRTERLRDNQKRIQHRREEETQQEKTERLKHLRKRAQDTRSEETRQVRNERLRDNQKRIQHRREQEMQQEMTESVEDQLESTQNKRRQEMGDERTRRVAEERARKRRRNVQIARRNLSADVGEMTKICPQCRAYRFSGETANFCCMQGKVNIAPLCTLPDELMKLYTIDTPQAKEFRKNIRQYNCLFQMTSFGAKEVVPPRPGWSPSVIIQGQIHHYIGPLMPDLDQPSQFLQIYFMDPQDSVELRMGILQDAGIQREIVEMLENLMRLNNPYINSIKVAKDRIRDLPEASIVIDPDRRPPFEHERRFNRQIANEVAVIIPNNNEPEATSRHIILKERGGGLRIISESHRSYDSLQYVLFFPLGDDGWHYQLKMRNSRKLTAMRYYAYKIMNRDNEFNQLLRGGRLFQQYVVDMAAKIENDRLNYIRLNQASLRSTTYKGLTDALNDNDDLDNIGKRIILSSTFVGGPRYMMERCQDAMMYVRKYGTASFFITMTCNPKWSEIQRGLFLNQQPCDRPDLITRVFDLKRKLFIKCLTGPDGLFGNCIAFVLTVEYQKRGLPHLHCLLWLDEANKPRPRDVDRFVQAEIPDPQLDPELHGLVLKHMIHGPYCKHTSQCWKNGRCNKRFPKPFIESTRCGDDSYPMYRRRSPDMGGFQGHQERRRHRPITSEWVVPYNAQLLKLFQCHLNVEICSSVKSVKYVIKYTLKGSDQAVFGLNRDDEIIQYLTGRYIGPSEAVGSILGFTTHERHPPVIRLQVHLPEEQRVVITADAVQRVRNDDFARTTLTAFMELCSRDQFARTLYYTDVPRFYTWNKKKWQRRKVGKIVEDFPGFFEVNVLGRVYTVSPRCGDLYYLRLLLHHVKGPVSFDSLRTHDGHILSSFKDVCIERGLLQDDDHWRQTMEDAEKTKLPGAIRDLFVVLLMNDEVNNPRQLWDRFKNSMSENFLEKESTLSSHQNIMIDERHHDQALLYIQDKLANYNKTLEYFHLPKPRNGRMNIVDNPELLHELQYSVPEQQQFVAEKEPMLNAEQRVVYDHVCGCLDRNVPSMIFIDSPAGTGKTFLTNLILSKVRGKGDVAFAVASSGIAATLMPGGRTAHSRFKIPIEVSENTMCNIEKNSYTAQLIRQVRLIVWDECPMIRRESFEAVDRTLRDICTKDEPFGGIITVCCGDFRQLLPVVKRGNDADIENSCIKKSYLWRTFTMFNLKRNMRLGDGEDDYSQFLLNVGEDRILKNEDDEIEIPQDMVLAGRSLEDCMDFIYPTFDNPAELFSNNCILVPLNDIMRSINSRCIRCFPGIMKTYLSFNAVTEGTDATHFPTEFLDSVEISGLPPHKLELKKGSPIILMRNLAPPRLCNGTRMIVEQLHNNLIVAKITIGAFRNEIVMIPRIPLTLTEGEDIPFQRRQFPVQTCFAMTIHRAQGQTMEKVLIYLEKPVFQHGQLYVALSRGKARENVKVFLKDTISTKNVVIRSVLR